MKTFKIFLTNGKQLSSVVEHAINKCFEFSFSKGDKIYHTLTINIDEQRFIEEKNVILDILDKNNSIICPAELSGNYEIEICKI